VAASRAPRLAGALALAGLLVFLATANRADDTLSVQFHTFQDTRGVTVLSPTVDLDKDFTERTGLRARFGVDSISAASDSCARCHPQGANNQRIYLSGAVRRKLGDTKLEIGGELSKERFYQASTLAASISRSLDKGNTTVAGGFSFSWNRPQLHPSEETMSQLAPSAYVAVTHAVSKGTAVQLGYQFDYVSGYQNSPFLRTILNGSWTLGETPEQRTRHALTARLRQALPGASYLEADYRRYFDSWSMRSDAIHVALSHHFTRSLTASAAYRRYGQNGAFFYAPFYVGTPEFYTGDFRLGPFDSNLYSATAALTPKSSWFHLPAGTTYSLEFERYAATTGFKADVFTAGIRMPLKR
jgi:Protein of unknown function (DUF3570)